MATTPQQRIWRRGAAASITVHLDALDAATLDEIAIALYEHNPHSLARPSENGINPSRPAAVRHLCAMWRAEHGPPRPKLARMRRALASFWRHETSWRRATEITSKARAPVPPWRR